MQYDVVTRCLVSSWILTSRQSHMVISGRMTFLLHQFKTQTTKQHVCLVHCYNVKKQPSIGQCTITHALVPISIHSISTHHGNGTCLNRLWPILFRGPTRGTVLAKTSRVEMQGEVLEKEKKWRWTDVNWPSVALSWLVSSSVSRVNINVRLHSMLDWA